MKGFTKVFIFNITLVILISLLAGCDNNSKETEADSERDAALETNNQEETNENESKSTTEDSNDTSAKESVSENENESNADNKSSNPEDNPLSGYSSKEIEYARVWLQLGANQDVEEIDVTHIPAGSSLNPEEDDIDVNYPEDVIQLRGSRIVDGIITYNGNGNGSINLYSIPYRWYGGMSRPDDVTADDIQKEREDIIENTELIHIDPGNDKEVINMIDKLHIH
ncbi:hypothetical protein AB4Y30_08070 [Ornithinibacillus sp. 4-3]|uniref:Lipoprotein n=1 Tax=Ornithinibacillus sp. 4-3 TaxID=3231488 RepID=A0AB39HVB2_9BACI